MPRRLEFLHTIASHRAHTSANAACISLLASAPDPMPRAGHAAVRHGIERIGTWRRLPALPVELTRGRLSIAAQPRYGQARRAWRMAVPGIPTLEGTLAGIQGPAGHAAALTARAPAGEVAPARVAPLRRDE